MYFNHNAKGLSATDTRHKVANICIGCCLLVSVNILLLTPSTFSGSIQTNVPLPAELQLTPPAIPTQLEPRKPVQSDKRHVGLMDAPAVAVKPKPNSMDMQTIQMWCLSLGGLAAVATLVQTLRTDRRKVLKEQGYSKEAIQDRIIKALKAGRGLEDFEEDLNVVTIPRNELVGELKAFIRPSVLNSYGIFLGPSGCGKSTAIRQALRQSKTSGAIYFMVPTAEADTGLLAELLDAEPLRPPSFYAASPAAAKSDTKITREDFVLWQVLQPCLGRALLQYKKDAGEPAVLIFDNINQYAKKNPPLLEALQLFAKECADTRLARIIFVGSESLALPVFQQLSAFSRAQCFISQYLDITDEEAVEYLKTTHDVAPERAEALVTHLAGGRFAILNQYGNSQFETTPVCQLVALVWTVTQKKLKAFSIKPTDDFFRKLVAESKIGIWDPVAEEIDTQGLMQMDIITGDPTGFLTFYSRHVATYFYLFARFYSFHFSCFRHDLAD